MKRYTRKIIVVLLLAIAFTACKKEHVPTVFTGHGTISIDFGMCMTCGGYRIVFDNDTTFFYRSYLLPTNSGITSSTKFPLKATIGWELDTSVKIPNFITVTSLRIDQ